MDANYWKGYRKTTGNLTWRLATKDDLPAMLKIRAVTERFLHQKQKKPPLFYKPVLLTLVAEDRRGKIVDVVYVESQVEVCKMGCTSAGFKEFSGVAEDLTSWLREVGFNRAVINAQRQIKEGMTDTLKEAGFSCVDEIFSQWILNL